MQEQEKQTAKGRDLYEWVQSLVGSVLVVVAIFTFVIRMMGVDGHSMLNTLQHGDRLLVVNSMLYHDYKYGDIVILRKNGVFDDDPIVKRVIAVEGQTVDIDFAEGIVYVDGKRIDMSPKEYDLLFYMIRNRNIALSREKLITEVWGYDYYGDDRTLDTHIKLLRRSLGDAAKYIVTLRGVGYRFDTNE